VVAGSNPVAPAVREKKPFGEHRRLLGDIAIGGDPPMDAFLAGQHWQQLAEPPQNVLLQLGRELPVLVERALLSGDYCPLMIVQSIALMTSY
jgi:hypothetical protein